MGKVLRNAEIVADGPACTVTREVRVDEDGGESTPRQPDAGERRAKYCLKLGPYARITM